MKAEELMIGDWVLWDNTLPCIVTTIGCDYIETTKCGITLAESHLLQGVPLTREILEKNGFKGCTNGDWTNDNIDFILYRRKDGIFRIQNTNITLPYVSSFQHALRLCGIDKDIEI